MLKPRVCAVHRRVCTACGSAPARHEIVSAAVEERLIRPWNPTRLAAAAPFLLAVFAPPLDAVEPPAVVGWARLAGGVIDSETSFLAGGYGKLVDGDLPESVRAGALLGELRLAVDWEPAPGWRLWLHGAARADERHVPPGDSPPGAVASGLLEGFAERRFGFGAGQEIGLKLGQFFLPASRENVEELWTSPYTLTLSALNSWIAEEIRPIGLDLAWSRTDCERSALDVGRQPLFGGNDTAGALLAWRGFALHDRPTPDRANSCRCRRWRRSRRPSRGRIRAARGLSPAISIIAWVTPAGRAGTRRGAARWSRRPPFSTTAIARCTPGSMPGRPTSAGCRPRSSSPPVSGFLGEWGTGTSEMGFAPPGRRSRSQVDIRLRRPLRHAELAARCVAHLSALRRLPASRIAIRHPETTTARTAPPGRWRSSAASASAGGSAWRLLHLEAVRPEADARGSPT